MWFVEKNCGYAWLAPRFCGTTRLRALPASRASSFTVSDDQEFEHGNARASTS